MPDIAICVITYRRPDGLARLLDGLARQDLDADLAIEVVVVDNDVDGSARRVYEERAGAYRWPLRYSVEPEPGISQARNHALTLAVATTTWIAFIDDDEVPVPTWLQALLSVAARTGADVVAGPVLPHFPQPVARWMVAGGYFDRERHRDGTDLPFTGTGNVLVHRRVFERLGTWFDPDLGLSGGGDTLFFMRVTRAAFRIVWADKAEAVEWVPASRATVSWLLRRNFRRGNGYTRCALLLDRSPLRRLERIAKGAARLVQGLVLMAVSLPRGRRVWMRHLLQAALGLGSLAAALGYFFQEYRRTAVPAPRTYASNR